MSTYFDYSVERKTLEHKYGTFNEQNYEAFVTNKNINYFNFLFFLGKQSINDKFSRESSFFMQS